MFSTLFTTPTAHPVENMYAINRHFSVLMFRHILDRHAGVTLVLTQCFKSITLISALFRVSAPLSPMLQGQEGMQKLTRLDRHGPLDGPLRLKFFHALTNSRISAFTLSTTSISGPFMSIIMRTASRVSKQVSLLEKC
jgi:hypothetical protein